MGARVELVRQVCGALQYAHQNLIVHRDIKPSNVLVDIDGAPKILDFGIAKLLVPAASLDRRANTRRARHLRGERTSHTFSPTALISAMYVKLVNGEDLEFNDRAHFFAVVSRIMRQILVDHARQRRAGKRGAGEGPVEIDPSRIAADRPWELAAVDDALDELARRNGRGARIIELHYFGGLTQKEIAEVCGIHPNTVARDLRFSKAWLRSYLRAES